MAQVQKTKKKTYEERLHEIKLQVRRTVGEYGYLFIPELCELLKQDHPEYTNKEIKDQVTGDCSDICEESSIYVYLPSWIHDQTQVRKIKKGWETRNANKLKTIKNVFDDLEKTQVSPPPVEAPEEKLIPLDEDIEKELYGIGLGKFGNTDASTRELLGDVTYHAAGLFKALMLRMKEIPHSVDADMIVDYIKPTREEWRSLMEEADDIHKARVHNWLSFLADVIEDRLTILSAVKAGKK